MSLTVLVMIGVILGLGHGELLSQISVRQSKSDSKMGFPAQRSPSTSRCPS